MKYAIDDKNPAAVLVRKLRTELGLTQQQLAVRAGVSYSLVNQVEGGKPTVRLDALNKILRVFGYAMAPSRSYEAHSAQNAWGPLQIPVSHPGVEAVSVPAMEPASAPPKAPESATPTPDAEAVRQKNDWTFY